MIIQLVAVAIVIACDAPVLRLTDLFASHLPSAAADGLLWRGGKRLVRSSAGGKERGTAHGDGTKRRGVCGA
ncbi:MAG: hypothetical protein ACOVNV_10010, partial [Pirellulaceae bacterium]